jgi:hypothetical protein
MNIRIQLSCITALLAVTSPAHADLLANNFWVNSTLESGSNLNQTNGIPSNWIRGGDDTNIDQVITNNSVSSSHSLALIDTDGSYGEWYSDVTLSGNATNGNTLNIQWYEMWNLPDGPGPGIEMRLTVQFLDTTNGIVGEIHFVTPSTTNASPGWMGTIASSTFTKRNGTATVPAGAVTMRCSLVSGGSSDVTGVIVIDDLSVAVIPGVTVLPPTILAGNFFPNPTFEVGVNLDNPSTAAPSGNWIRGGNDPTINLVITNNSVSPTHSLALVDNSNGYGEWYNFFTLSGVATDDVLDVQFFQLYDTTNGSMRLSFAFIDSMGFTLANTDFNAPTNGSGGSGGQSPGWLGSIAASPFERVSGRLLVPANTVKLRVNFASGGAGSVTGIMVIDDLSVRLSKPLITAFGPESGGFNIIWNSMPSKTYTVQFTSTLGTSWTSLVTGQPGDISLSNSYLDTIVHPGKTGFYRVIQE